MTYEDAYAARWREQLAEDMPRIIERDHAPTQTTRAIELLAKYRAFEARGLNAQEVADALGCTKQAVQMFAQRHGVKLARVPRPRGNVGRQA